MVIVARGGWVDSDAGRGEVEECRARGLGERVLDQQERDAKPKHGASRALQRSQGGLQSRSIKPLIE